MSHFPATLKGRLGGRMPHNQDAEFNLSGKEVPKDKQAMKRARSAFRNKTEIEGVTPLSRIPADARIRVVEGACGAVVGAAAFSLFGLGLSVVFSPDSNTAYVPASAALGAVFGALINALIYRQIPEWLEN